MLRRHLEPLLVESLASFPVVLLTGARQVGKSTLVQALVAGAPDARYLTLDDRTTLDAALTDPEGLIVHQPARLTVVDEVQRAPDLLRAVKRAVDRDRRPGAFLLTGSANLLTLERVSETLAGRVAVHELRPFTWTELSQRPPPATTEDLFTARDARTLARRWRGGVSRRQELADLVLSGGFPTPALMRPGRARRRWFDSYLQTYVERDLRDAANLQHMADFGRLLTTLALRTGQLLNLSSLARDVGLPLTTLRRYFHALEQTYQTELVHPFFANVEKRLVKTPKAYAADTGLCCHLAAAESWDALVRQNRAGAMIETLVAGELRKLLPLAAARTDLWFLRTHSGDEVDFILERGGAVVGIEVKWSDGFAPGDLAGLARAREMLGSRWRLGVLAHAGTETVALDAQSIAVPLGVLLGRDP